MKRSAAHLNWCPRPRRALHFSTGVYKGGEVVKKLLEQPAVEGKLKTPVDLRRVIRND
jgi:hypothetical protein